MIAPQDIALGRAAFTEGSASKFATPDHQGFVEEITLFKVTYQGGDRLVHRFAAICKAGPNATALVGTVEIPSPVK